MRQILLQGHRGARGLIAEHTLSSVGEAFSQKMDGIEFDVQLSADNQLVLHHDLYLNPAITRDRNNHWLKKPTPAIKSLTLGQLKQYKLGAINKSTDYGRRFLRQKCRIDEPIITLAELVDYLREHQLSDKLLNIEIKHSPLSDGSSDINLLAHHVVEQIHKLNLTQSCIVQSFNWSVIQAVRALDNHLPISCLTNIDKNEDTLSPVAGKTSLWNAGLDIRDFNGSVAAMVKAFDAPYWAPNYRNLTKSEFDTAAQLDIKVMTWTVNHASSMKKLFNWGIDAIISDYPDRLILCYQNWRTANSNLG